MTDHLTPRLFKSGDDIRHIGNAMLACRLPKEAWTHEAHLAVCYWLMAERADIDINRDIGPIIRRYNESVGGTNDATQGYHETITRAFVAGVRLHRVRSEAPDLLAGVNALLMSAEGSREWPLRFWSRERLFSVEARLGYCPPDLDVPDLAGLLPWLPRAEIR